MSQPSEPLLADVERADVIVRLDDAGRVSGRLAHDFDNLLMGVLGFTELARAQAANGSRIAEFLDELSSVAESGRAMTRQLHAFSRAGQATKLPTRLQEISGTAAFGDLLSAPGGVDVTVDIPGDLPPVAIAPEPLLHICGSLLRNAYEAMPDGGHVRLAARTVTVTEPINAALPVKPGKYVELTVADEGPGFPTDSLARVGREPFITTKHRHRGLGLPTVLRTAQAHGGGVRIESSHRGAAVTVYLPSADSTSREPQQRSAAPAPLEVGTP